MKYIKFFESIEEYEEWMKSHSKEVFETEEKICVDGVIISHTNDEFRAIGDNK